MRSNQPLAGKRIVLTRHVEGSHRLGSRLRHLGAEIFELPLIEIHYAPDAEKADAIFDEFGHYEWLIFTSRSGVKYFFKAFFSRFDDIRSLGFVRIAAVGEGTVEALGEFWLKPELVPSRASAMALADAFREEQTLDNLKVLCVTGNRNREGLIESLEADRAIVDTFRVYRTDLRDCKEDPMAALFRKEGADALVFSSSSAVEAFGQQASSFALESGAKIPALCSFGPSTSETMRKSGIPIAVESAEPGLEGMVQGLLEYFERKPS